MFMSIEQVIYLFLVITEHNWRHVGIRKEKKKQELSCETGELTESKLHLWIGFEEKREVEDGKWNRVEAYFFFGFMASLLSSKRLSVNNPIPPSIEKPPQVSSLWSRIGVSEIWYAAFRYTIPGRIPYTLCTRPKMQFHKAQNVTFLKDPRCNRICPKIESDFFYNIRMWLSCIVISNIWIQIKPQNRIWLYTPDIHT